MTETTETTSALEQFLGDRYTIERVLGRGGMAIVHLAEEKKHQRKVAIKVLREDISMSVGAERFIREIGIAASLSHPHILPLIDSGESHGLLYYVSPYVAGGSLRDRIDRDRTLPVEDALRIATEVGAGLDYAHRSGFVHRDVKAENILFADDHAVLADFGIAHVRMAPDGDPLTKGGIALGTPEYMSPEQASGSDEIGAPTDIYALACVVFEMLTGQPPFKNRSELATMARHVTEKPRSTVAEFTAALRESGFDRVRRPSTSRSIAVLPFINASPEPDNEYLSDGITDELIDALAKVEGLRVASRTSVFALKGKQQDVRVIGALLEVSDVLEGTVRRSGQDLRITAQLTSTTDGSLTWSHRYDRRLDDVFAIQDEIARTIVNTLRITSFTDLADPATTKGTDNVHAYGLYLRGRYAWNKRTQEGVTEGIQFFEQAVAADPGYALAYTGLADSYSLHVDYRNVPVHEGFRLAKSYAKKALDLDDTLAEAHASLAWSVFIYDWDWAAAESEFRRAIALDPRYATARQWYAFLLASQGRFEDALVEAHTSQDLDPGSVSIRRGLGYVYVYARRYEQAAHHLKRAVAMNPTAEESYRILGLIHSLAGDHEEAERILREGVELASAEGTYTRVTLAFALAAAGNGDYAGEMLGVLQDKMAGDYVSPVEMATVHIALGDSEQALDWIERSREERRGWTAYLNVHPILDAIRDEPRFAEIARRMKFPPK